MNTVIVYLTGRVSCSDDIYGWCHQLTVVMIYLNGCISFSDYILPEWCHQLLQ